LKFKKGEVEKREGKEGEKRKKLKEI